jgi:methanogenic corrinoid protein MtbC1
MSDPAELYDAILTGNAKKAEQVTKEALDAGVDPSQLLSKYMIPAMDEVGSRFECNEYFVPELLISARAMKISLALLTPKLAAAGAKAAGSRSSIWAWTSPPRSSSRRPKSTKAQSSPCRPS